MPKNKRDANISLFLQSLAAETGASQNTVSAYESDLILADTHIQTTFETSLSVANELELLSCLSIWQRQGKAPRTVARRISALRHMMKWLVYLLISIGWSLLRNYIDSLELCSGIC